MNRVKKENLTLSYRRSLARELAWKREIKLVRQGRGTRNWTMEEQKELLTTGRIKKYVAHHIKSVKEYPEHADNVDNIQFLTRKEHYKAHLYNWKQSLHLCFDHVKQSISWAPMSDKVYGVPVVELKTKYAEVLEKVNNLEQQYGEKKNTFKSQIETFLKENESLSNDELERELSLVLKENDRSRVRTIVSEFRNGESRYYLDAYAESEATKGLIKRAVENGRIYQSGGRKHYETAWQEFASKRAEEDHAITEKMERLAARTEENSKMREYYERTAGLYRESAIKWGESISSQLTLNQDQQRTSEKEMKKKNTRR